MIDRPPTPSAKENREAQGRPKQREFVAPFGPEVTKGPLENNDDHQHLDKYHRRSNARQKANRQACRGDEFAEECQVSQRQRQRQALVADADGESVRRGMKDLLKTVGKENGAGGEPHERVTVGCAGLVDPSQRGYDQPPPVDLVEHAFPLAQSRLRDGTFLDQALSCKPNNAERLLFPAHRLGAPSPRGFGCAGSC